MAEPLTIAVGFKMLSRMNGCDDWLPVGFPQPTPLLISQFYGNFYSGLSAPPAPIADAAWVSDGVIRE